LFSGSSQDNAATLLQLRNPEDEPHAIRSARLDAGAAQWRNRGTMLLAVNEDASAHDAFAAAAALEPDDRGTLDGLVNAAIPAHREASTLSMFKASLESHPQSAAIWIALSKLLASTGSIDEAVNAANRAAAIAPANTVPLEQLASIFADRGDATRLAPVVAQLEQLQPEGVGTLYYAAALRFIRGQLPEALELLRRVTRINPDHAAAANLIGAIHATRGEREPARAALLTALRLNPKDSATYTNLGLLELSAGNRAGASRYFVEALALDPGSQAARQGLAEAR
jgi:Flp pilus assembly protein TadD